MTYNSLRRDMSAAWMYQTSIHLITLQSIQELAIDRYFLHSLPPYHWITVHIMLTSIQTGWLDAYCCKWITLMGCHTSHRRFVSLTKRGYYPILRQLLYSNEISTDWRKQCCLVWIVIAEATSPFS